VTGRFGFLPNKRDELLMLPAARCVRENLKIVRLLGPNLLLRSLFEERSVRVEAVGSTSLYLHTDGNNFRLFNK
jgi:hypothetical protein